MSATTGLVTHTEHPDRDGVEPGGPRELSGPDPVIDSLLAVAKPDGVVLLLQHAWGSAGRRIEAPVFKTLAVRTSFQHALANSKPVLRHRRR